jgi:hypothetical protein
VFDLGIALSIAYTYCGGPLWQNLPQFSRFWKFLGMEIRLLEKEKKENIFETKLPFKKYEC